MGRTPGRVQHYRSLFLFMTYRKGQTDCTVHYVIYTVGKYAIFAADDVFCEGCRLLMMMIQDFPALLCKDY